MTTKNIKPTFGISFGLPQQGGGYPINLHGPNSLVNPYGGTIGAAGINLGLVSVSPLISVQVTDDAYGEKTIKPYINFHVTPNDYLVHKLEHLLDYKKEVLYNKHEHCHYSHHPHKLHYHHKPHYHYGPPVRPHYIPTPQISYPHEEDHDEDYYNQNVGNSYYDDPLNYGGSYQTGYDTDFLGRAVPNVTNTVDGNYLLQQYQNQYNAGENVYGNVNNLDNDLSKSERSYNVLNVRRGKTLLKSASNPIKFPTDRKRRDVTETDSDYKVRNSDRPITQKHGGVVTKMTITITFCVSNTKMTQVKVSENLLIHI